MAERHRSANMKNPPVWQGGDQSYSMYKKELQFWCEYTDLKPEERGFAILFRLEEKDAKEAVMRLDMNEIKCERGVDNIINIMDKLYAKETKISLYETYCYFEEYRRPTGTNISDFINEFERRHAKTKEHNIEMSENLLAFRLLKCCNLSKHQERLARATVTEWNYDEMRKQLKQIFGDSSVDDYNEINKVDTPNQIKPLIGENPNYEEAYYNFRYRNNNRRPNQRYSRTRSSRGNNYNRGRGRAQNPPDESGRPSSCNYCGSRFHWAKDCPELSRQPTNNTFEINSLELYQSVYDKPNGLKELVSDTFDAAVLDTAATKTAAGRIWTEEYIKKLTDEEKSRIEQKPSSAVYRFGDGEKVTASYSTTIPAKIGNRNVTIDVDVIEKDIPLLLSRPSMEQINTTIDLKNQQVTMLDQKIPIFTSKSGHYCVPLTDKKRVISQTEPTHTTFIFNTVKQTKKEIATKLHSQFSHPSAFKLVSLIKSSGHARDTDLIREIHNVSNNCKICKEFRRPPRRPVVGLPIATNFNECLQLDLKFFEGTKTPMLHMIDHCTRLSSCALLRNKTADEVFKGLITHWFSIYGSPQKILSDNGGEFSNSLIRELAEKFNITVYTTAAESPWANGLTERHNYTMGEMIKKTMKDSKCSLPIAIAWATNAKNSLQNVNGYSPYQLVYGRNPNLPDIFNSKPPSFSDNTESKLIAEVLAAKKAAREAFIRQESDEKIRRALQHNIRSSNDIKFVTGDRVYYYRNNTNRWHGPATVLGQDRQTVLVNHGGNLVRCHPCRLTLIDSPTNTKQPSSTNNNNCKLANTNTTREFSQQPVIPNINYDSYESDTSIEENNTTDDENDINAISQLAFEYNEDLINLNEDDQPLVLHQHAPTIPQLQQIEDFDPLTHNHETVPQIEFQEHENLRILLQNLEDTDHQEEIADPDAALNAHENLMQDADHQEEIDNPDVAINPVLLPTADHQEEIDDSDAASNPVLLPRDENAVQQRANKQLDPQKLPLMNLDLLKTGTTVKCRLKNDDSTHTVYLVSRAGRATGKYKYEYNTVDEDGIKSVIDFKEHVSEMHLVLRQCDPIEEETININIDSTDEKQAAKLKELDSWKNLNVYEEVEDLNQSCISVRWVFKEKQNSNNETFIKARLCCRGFEEDKSKIRSDSPTATKESIRFTLSVAAAKGWDVLSLDVSTAFLQSFKMSRKVYIRPPPEANTNKIWLLNKPIYGLTDSSRLWYLTIRQKLLNLGLHVNTHDQGLFYLHRTEELESIIVIFVDDILLTGKNETLKQITNRIKDMFIVGSQNTESFRYLGMNITQHDDKSISLDQTEYIKSINSISTDTIMNRHNEDDSPLKQKDQLRSLVGKFNWILSVSRPDIAYETRILSTIISEAKMKDIYRANKLLRYMKSEETTLNFPSPMNMNQLHLLVFADSSYGNLRNAGSQGAYIILLSDLESCSLLSWNSYRLKRVAKSTLSAETLSLGEALDAALLYAQMYGEILNQNKDNIPILCFTDSKGLYKTSQTKNLSSDKNLQINISSIREMIERKEIKLLWIGSKFQLANSLTKQGASTRCLKQVISSSKLVPEILNVIRNE